jgi:hypothetical protein
MEIIEVYGIRAIIPHYNGVECERPDPVPQFPDSRAIISTSQILTLGPETMYKLNGWDHLEDDGTPMGHGWGHAVVYAGMLQHLGPLFVLIATVLAHLTILRDMELHPEVYQDGEY